MKSCRNVLGVPTTALFRTNPHEAHCVLCKSPSCRSFASNRPMPSKIQLTLISDLVTDSLLDIVKMVSRQSSTRRSSTWTIIRFHRTNIRSDHKFSSFTGQT